MARTSLVSLFSLLAALPLSALATSPAYTYRGCVVAPANAFPHITANAPVSGVSPAECRDSCSALGRFAAVGGGMCRCSVNGPYGTGPDAFSTVDDARCSAPCALGSAEAGRCGGEKGSSTWSLWVRESDARELKMKSKRNLPPKKDNDDEEEFCDDDEDDGGDHPGAGSPTGPHGPGITGAPGGHSTVLTTIVHTITSCPPDVVSCPARITSYVATHTIGGNGTIPTTSPSTPSNPPIPTAAGSRVVGTAYVGTLCLLAAVFMA